MMIEKNKMLALLCVMCTLKADGDDANDVDTAPTLARSVSNASTDVAEWNVENQHFITVTFSALEGSLLITRENNVQCFVIPNKKLQDALSDFRTQIQESMYVLNNYHSDISETEEFEAIKTAISGAAGDLYDTDIVADAPQEYVEQMTKFLQAIQNGIATLKSLETKQEQNVYFLSLMYHELFMSLKSKA